MHVGISIAQTGALSALSLEALHSVQLWVSHIQRKGGIRVGQQSLPVHLIIRDDQSRTSVARKNVESIISKDHVDILLGPYSSHLTKAAAEICCAHQRLFWNHGGASDEIWQPGSDWIVSNLTLYVICIFNNAVKLLNENSRAFARNRRKLCLGYFR